jgi:hypothetical protein
MYILQTGGTDIFMELITWGADHSLHSSITRHSAPRVGVKIVVYRLMDSAGSDSPSEYAHSCVRMLISYTIQSQFVVFLACSYGFLRLQGERVALGFALCKNDTAVYMVVIECCSSETGPIESNIFDISVYHNLAEGLDVLSVMGILDDTQFQFTVSDNHPEYPGRSACVSFSDIMSELRTLIQPGHSQLESSPEI